ncbi:hypothetical protein K492DRAFT_178200 [Lichtheimia hyalospora FSU 10163]|nr:hypothetical protein K492DRAFT_178200 [Lichtheimia hyalospora FSU 10163]
MDRFPAAPSASPLSMQYHQHITSTASLPLTKENLSHAEECEPSISMLARYYHDLSLPPLPMSPRRERKPSSTTRSIRSDTVLASPRLSPFPYHNDSLFLPMAEKQQPIYHQQMHHSQSSLHPLQQKRPSSASEPHHRRSSPLAMTPPRRHVSAPPMDRATRRQWHHDHSLNDTKMRWPGAFRHWFARLFQGKKQGASCSTTKHHCLSEDSPVWYSQFAGNPSPPTERPMMAVA